MKTLLALQVVAVVVAMYITIGLKASFATSAVKAIAGSCHKSYFIEVPYFISGNWFCSTSKGKK